MNEKINLKLIAMMGDTIKTSREKRGFTQAALCEAAGVSLRTFQRVEGGTQWPSLIDAFMICTALDIPLTLLFANKAETQNYFKPKN